MKFLADFSKDIVPNVSSLEGNSIDDDERVSFGLVTGAKVGRKIEFVDWSDSVIERCRFESTELSNSSFERVAIIDCDLSGVTLNNCLLRECLISEIKAQSYLSFDNCILDRVLIARSRVERFDIQHCSIVEVSCLGLESDYVNLHQCKAHKRKGNVTLQESEISKLSGAEELFKNGLTLQVDTNMWRNLGDYYLKEMGFQQQNWSLVPNYSLLDEIGEGISQCKN